MDKEFEQIESKSDPRPFRLRTRWCLYLGTWVAVFLSFRFAAEARYPPLYTLDLIGLQLYCAWMLPLGIPAVLTGKRADAFSNLPWLLPIWAGYLIHGWLTLRSRRKVRFVILLVLLAIFLCGNLIACENSFPNIRI